jgi:hypothetical protein
MTDESAALATLRGKITAYLDQASIPYRIDERGCYTFRQGSTLVFIQPLEWSDYAMVKVFAPLAVEIQQPDGDLALYLADRNFNLLFGKFSLDLARRTVWLEHVLLGDFLDPQELLLTLEVIAYTADRYDEQIAQQAGGKRIIDLTGRD